METASEPAESTASIIGSPKYVQPCACGVTVDELGKAGFKRHLQTCCAMKQFRHSMQVQRSQEQRESMSGATSSGATSSGTAQLTRKRQASASPIIASPMVEGDVGAEASQHGGNELGEAPMDLLPPARVDIAPAAALPPAPIGAAPVAELIPTLIAAASDLQLRAQLIDAASEVRRVGAVPPGDMHAPPRRLHQKTPALAAETAPVQDTTPAGQPAARCSWVGPKGGTCFRSATLGGRCRAHAGAGVGAGRMLELAQHRAQVAAVGQMLPVLTQCCMTMQTSRIWSILGR